jgi:hypothetical protein
VILIDFDNRPRRRQIVVQFIGEMLEVEKKELKVLKVKKK